MKLIVSLVISMAFSLAQAQEHNYEASYYKGQQPVGIAGDTVDCFVEAEFSPKGSQVSLRALVADPHDQTALVGKMVAKAKYSSSKKGYYYLASSKQANVQEMLLSGNGKKTAVGMSLTFSDEGHLDTVTCENLALASKDELEMVEDMFLNFDQFVKEDHDHEHDDHEHQH